MTEIMLAKMTWPEVAERLKMTDIALLPTGSIEQHGPHLPLETDIAIAEGLAIRIAQEVAEDVKAVVAPAIPIGASDATFRYAGGLTLDEVTLLAVWTQVVKGLIRNGFKKIVIVNGHGGNKAILSTLVSRIHRETGAFLAIVYQLGVSPGLIDELIEAESRQWGHACEIETSLAMALGIQARMDLAINEEVHVADQLRDYWPYYDPKVRIPFSEPYGEWSDKGWQGVMGDARLASMEKGERLLEAIVAVGADLLRNIQTLPVTIKPFSFP